MKNDIKIIALDLDGTLLNSKKELTEENYLRLSQAAAQGVEIVPTTGRYWGLMPEKIRALPFLHYAITINGAAIFDIRKNETVVKAEIPMESAREIMAYLDQFDVIYDCYSGNAGFMTAALQARVDDFTDDPHYRKMLKEFRKPVPELKSYILSHGMDVQKIQLFVKDLELRTFLMQELRQRNPDVSVSSAFKNNIELTHLHANKGEALLKLADYLGVDQSSTMACGDMLNDLSMIEAAGIGVAMGNAAPEVKAKADYITEDCDHNGVGKAIAELVLGK